MSEWDFPEEYTVGLTHNQTKASYEKVYASSAREAAEQFLKAHRFSNIYVEGGDHVTTLNSNTGESLKFYVFQHMVPMYEAYEEENL